MATKDMNDELKKFEMVVSTRNNFNHQEDKMPDRTPFLWRLLC